MAAQHPVATNYRFWAEAPPSISDVVVQVKGDDVVVPRPTFPKGVCRQCGCTHTDPCIDALGECCAWADDAETLCNFCRSGVIRWRRPKDPRARRRRGGR